MDDGREEHQFVVDDVSKIIKEAIETTIGGNSYQHDKVNNWTGSVVETCLSVLTKLQKPYKYIAHQRPSATSAANTQVFLVQPAEGHHVGADKRHPDYEPANPQLLAGRTIAIELVGGIGGPASSPESSGSSAASSISSSSSGDGGGDQRQHHDYDQQQQQK